jgi:hypothetical protein
MTFLQQPVLFASDPSSSLVGLGLLLTLAAIVGVAALVVTFALSSSDSAQPKRRFVRQPRHPHPTHTGGEAALS